MLALGKKATAKRARIAPAESFGVTEPVECVQEELAGLRLWRDSLLSPITLAGTYSLQRHEEKRRLGCSRLVVW